jgi:5-oxoprolinase (ATP-hydrolysing) subunit A
MSPARYDINCDLGEGEAARKTKALMRHITSASIACGGHAGTLQTMSRAVGKALEAGVKIGAHPGLSDPTGFGRRMVELSVDAFETLLLQQIGALEKVASEQGAQLHHVKLHGALYHLTDFNRPMRDAYLSLLRQLWPSLILFARAGGETARDGEKAGIAVWPEGFLDRLYLPDETLSPRGSSGAILNRLDFVRRLNSLAQGMSPISVPVRTWCIHSDTPNALEFARLARTKLKRERTG